MPNFNFIRTLSAFQTSVHPRSQKLTPYQRAVIHDMALWSDLTQAEIAATFGINQSTVSKIKFGDWNSSGFETRILGVSA